PGRHDRSGDGEQPVRPSRPLPREPVHEGDRVRRAGCPLAPRREQGRGEGWDPARPRGAEARADVHRPGLRVEDANGGRGLREAPSDGGRGSGGPGGKGHHGVTRTGSADLSGLTIDRESPPPSSGRGPRPWALLLGLLVALIAAALLLKPVFAPKALSVTVARAEAIGGTPGAGGAGASEVLTASGYIVAR